jgi:WD40 repeat protein
MSCLPIQEGCLAAALGTSICHKGLERNYREFLDRELSRDERTWESRYRPLLSVLLVAGGEGLAVHQLKGITGFQASEVDDALKRLRQYLAESSGGLIRIFHQSFVDYLHGERDLPLYPDEANQAITEYFFRTYASDWLQATQDDYARKHLATNAAAVGRLDELLTDPRFMLVVDPDHFLVALPHGTSPSARQAASVYRRTISQFRFRSRAGAAAYLQLHARQLGADKLAERISTSGLALPWSVPWANWNADPYQTLGEYSSRVGSVALCKLNSMPVAMSASDEEGAARVWDLRDGSELIRFTGRTGPADVVTVGEVNGRLVALFGTESDTTIRVWDLEADTQVTTLIGHTDKVQAVAVGNVDGVPVAVSGGKDYTARIWDLQDGTQLAMFSRHHNYVSAVALGKLNGRPIVVSGAWEEVRVWDPRDARQLLRMSGHSMDVHAVAVGEVGGRPVAVSGGDDGTVLVWDLQDGTQLARLVGRMNSYYYAAVYAVAVAEVAGRPFAVSGGYGQAVWVWDLNTHTEVISAK